MAPTSRQDQVHMASRINVARSPLGSEDSHSPSEGSQVAHTLTACCRCRQRKTRCDAGIPRCGPCERNNAYCEYFDAAKGRKMPRAYVIQLQNRVRELEKELAAHSSNVEQDPDQETLLREAGFVKLQDHEEASFLGPSSGINTTRLVLELAKGIRKIKKIKDLVPEEQARRIRLHFEAEAQKPTSKDYPEISSVAAPNLPSFDLTDMLVGRFLKKGQALYPVLHEPSLRQTVQNVYSGSGNAYDNFVLRLVIALGMQQLSSQWTGLADSYYLAALPYLERTIRKQDLGTVQAFMLIAQYSMVTPTRTAATWIVGLAVKLCQELGITQESTIGFDSMGRLLDPLEVDLRRRCYWVCASMELGLAHSMGRPNAFGTPHTAIDVRWFELADDKYITRKAILPAPLCSSKRISKHFISMRLLQLEIRRTLYLKHREHPVNDRDPWFQAMEQKLDDWLAATPEDNNGTPFNKEWFTARYTTLVVFLCRPSPQIPQPSIRLVVRAFEASRQIIELQRKQIDAKYVDLTWIFASSVYMSINTTLWALSYAEIRSQYPRQEVELLLSKALETAYFCSLKWPGVEGAIELYGTLQHTCLKAYDSAGDQPSNLSPSATLSSSATSGSPEPMSSPSSADFQQQLVGLASPSSPTAYSGHSPPSRFVGQGQWTQNHNEHHLTPEPSSAARFSFPENSQVPSTQSAPNILLSTASNSSVEPVSLTMMNLPLFEPALSLPAPGAEYATWYSAQPAAGLSLHQQSELMRQLEANRNDGMFS